MSANPLRWTFERVSGDWIAGGKLVRYFCGQTKARKSEVAKGKAKLALPTLRDGWYAHCGDTANYAGPFPTCDEAMAECQRHFENLIASATKQ